MYVSTSLHISDDDHVWTKM